MDLKFVPPTSDILPGDRLITSGLDHVYPKDILVGTIKDTHLRLEKRIRLCRLTRHTQTTLCSLSW